MHALRVAFIAVFVAAFASPVPVGAQNGIPSAVTARVVVHVTNASNGTAVPGRNVYLVREAGWQGSGTNSTFEAGETDVEGTAVITGALLPGAWIVEVYGGLLFDYAMATIHVTPGQSAYEVSLPMKPSSGRWRSRDLPVRPPGERALYIRVQGKLPNGKIVPVKYAAIYTPQDREIVMTGADGTAVIWHRVPLGEMLTLRAEANHWEDGTASFIAGASESGSRMTRADDYINFMLNSTEPPGKHTLSIRVQGRKNGKLVPVHYAMISDSQGHEVVMTGADGTAVAHVYDLPVGEQYQLHAEANHWKPGTETVTTGASQNTRLTSGNDFVNFVLEPEESEIGGRTLLAEVLDHDTDKPISGATVTLYKPNRFPGKAVARGTTDANGHLLFNSEMIGRAQLQGQARLGATHGGYAPNVQDVSAEQLGAGEHRFVLFLRQRKQASGFDLSGPWVFTWTWSVTSVDFIGTVSGGPQAFTFQGKVLGGGNAIWTAKEGSATCNLNAEKPAAAVMTCTASFPDGGAWTGQTAQGEFSKVLYGHAKRFQYEGRHGKGQAKGSPPAGIDLFELKPKGS